MSASFKKNPDGERHSGFGRDGSGVAGPTSYEIGLLPLFNWCEQRKTLTTKLLEREKGEEWNPAKERLKPEMGPFSKFSHSWTVIPARRQRGHVSKRSKRIEESLECPVLPKVIAVKLLGYHKDDFFVSRFVWIRGKFAFSPPSAQEITTILPDSHKPWYRQIISIHEVKEQGLDAGWENLRQILRIFGLRRWDTTTL